MEKTQEILKHLFDLYRDKEHSEESILNWCAKNLERYKAYESAFNNYDMLDVFKAIDEYWRYCNNKTIPTVAKLLAMLNTNKAETEKKQELRERYFSPEVDYMWRDIEIGRNLDCCLSHYRRTCSYIHKKILPELIGWHEWSKLQPDEWYALSLRNGLYNDFDALLRQIKECNIDYN